MPKLNSEQMHTQITQELFKYCMFNLRNRELAEDCVSETYVRWLSKPNSPQEFNQLKAWLIGIARNVIKEKYRESTKFMNIDVEPTISDETSELALNEELVALIKKELNKLDELAREIVVLKIWEGLTFPQIAEITGENENNCKSIYYRSLETIKVALGEKKKGKKLYAVPVPLIISGVQALSRKPQLQVSNQFVATSWENASLRENFLNINNLTTMQKALLWLKAHRIAAIISGCVLLAVILVAVIFLVTRPSNPGNETTSSSTASSTSLSVTTTVSSTTTTPSSTTSTISNDFSYRGWTDREYEVSGAGSVIAPMYRVTLKTPGEVTSSHQSNPILAADELNVVGNSFILKVFMPREGFGSAYDVSKYPKFDGLFAKNIYQYPAPYFKDVHKSPAEVEGFNYFTTMYPDQLCSEFSEFPGQNKCNHSAMEYANNVVTFVTCKELAGAPTNTCEQVVGSMNVTQK